MLLREFSSSISESCLNAFSQVKRTRNFLKLTRSKTWSNDPGTYLHLFSQLPQNPSQACIVFLIEHLVRVAALDGQNKMSLHNLATVFGPTMLHAGPGRGNPAELLANSTSDVMAQSGILHYFLARRARGEPIQILERSI